MIYELISISDPYTLEADRKDVAVTACFVLGNGQYGLHDADGETVAGPFIFGGAAEWFETEFGVSYEAWFEPTENIEALAVTLESVCCGSVEDRSTFVRALELMAPDKAAIFRAEWQDKRSTSLNDIGGRAYQIAASIRTWLAGGTADVEIPKAPQQVHAVP